MRRISLFLISLTLLLGLAAGSAWAEQLLMATTTSTDNTGILEVIKDAYQKDTGVELVWTAVGTGKALKMGEMCDVSVLLVHAPAAEQTFVDSGFGTQRYEVMYNDFVIIGPESDPAGVKGMDVADALKTIGEKKAVFVSRGDDSGTNKKEISLWKDTGSAVPEKQDWYVQTGQGMLTTINVAAEKNGYTMTDRGTYIKYEADNNGNPPLKILVEGDKILFNQYSVIPIDPKHCPDTDYKGAMQFAEWLSGPTGQKLIGDFTLMGKTLFTANAPK